MRFSYVKGLDVLRFLGAMSVICLHLGSSDFFKAHGLSRLHILVSGTTGVQLFYVISGFLITSIIASEVALTGKFSAARFLYHRTLRIFPLYYFALLTYVAIDSAGIQHVKSESLWWALLYSYNFVPRNLYDGWLGSFHTLATEEHFYLLYALIWFALMKFRASPVPVLLVMFGMSGPLNVLSLPFNEGYFLSRWTFNAWGPLLIGCMFGLYHHHWGPSLARGRLAYLLAFVVLFLSQTISFNSTTLSFAFGLLILHFATNQTRPSTQFLGLAPFKFLGGISYGLYVWQSVIISTGPSRRLFYDPLLAATCVFVLATASWFLIERPMAKLRSRPNAAVAVVSVQH